MSESKPRLPVRRSWVVACAVILASGGLWLAVPRAAEQLDRASAQEVAPEKTFSGLTASSIRHPIALSDDGRMLAYPAAEGQRSDLPLDILVQDIGGEGAPVRINGISYLSSLRLSPDGSMLAVGTRNGCFQLWQTRDQIKRAEILGIHRDIGSLVFSLDGRHVVGGGRGPIMWDTVTGAFEREYKGSSGWASFSPDRKTVITGGGSMDVRVWDVASGNLIAKLPGHDEGCIFASFSADGKVLATTGLEPTIHLWAMPEGCELGSIPAASSTLHYLSLSPDGREVLAVALRKPLGINIPDDAHIWDVRTRRELGSIPDVGDTAEYTPDGQWIITSDGTNGRGIGVRDRRTRRLKFVLSGGHPPLVVSRDGSCLAASQRGEAFDQRVGVWILSRLP